MPELSRSVFRHKNSETHGKYLSELMRQRDYADKKCSDILGALSSGNLSPSTEKMLRKELSHWQAKSKKWNKKIEKYR